MLFWLKPVCAWLAKELRASVNRLLLAPVIGSDMICGTDRICRGRVGKRDQRFLESLKSYTKQIHEQCRQGQWQKALSILGEMQQRGLEPNVITYNALISACEKGHNAEKAMELFVEMHQRGLEPNVITYTTLISACAKDHNAEKAMELFTEM